MTKKLKVPHIATEGSDTQEMVNNLDIDVNQTDYNRKILVETEKQEEDVGQRSTKNLQPPVKVRIVTISRSVCWTKEEKQAGAELSQAQFS